jgi:hypothetical protein
MSKTVPRPHSVKVLGRATPTLTRVADQASRQGFWQQWLANHVPAG